MGALTLLAPAFERDLREGRIALLFDGFDELANRVRSAAIPEHFCRILNAARYRARDLLTSRAEHFVSQRDAVEVLQVRVGGPTAGLAGPLQALLQRRLVVTQKFTNEQIEAYLSRALGSPEAGKQRMARFQKVHDLAGLATTPRMLAFLVALTEEQIEAAAKKGNEITPTELYRIVIVDHWLAQQEQRLNPSRSAPGPTRDALLESVKRLALHLWRSTAKSIEATDLDDSTGEQLRRLCDDDSDVARHMLQSRTLLVHGEVGRLTFIHQTVMEWLVGQALAERIKTPSADGDLDTGRLSDFLIDVLRDLLGDDGLAGWANRVLSGTLGNRLAENARLALARMGRQAERKKADLRGQTFRGQSLQGQDLRGALLDDADLHEADLVGRDLTGASLQRANLSRADLLGANLTNASGEGLAVALVCATCGAVGGLLRCGVLRRARRDHGGSVERAGRAAEACADWKRRSQSRTAV